MADEFGHEKELTSDLCKKAAAKGASQAEAYFAEEEELVIEVRDQQVEDLKAAKEHGIGLRVLVGKRLGFAYTTDLSPASLERLAEEAVANARGTGEDPFQVMPVPAGYSEDLVLFDPRLEQVPLEDKVEMAMAMERAGRAFDSRIRVTESSGYQETRYRIVLANSLGTQGAYRGGNCGLQVALVASEDGTNETGFHFQYDLNYDTLKPEETGRRAAAKAVEMLGAKPVTPRSVPVVMDPYVTVNFLGVLASSFSADAVQKGRSLLAEKLEQKIGAAAVTVIDDGILPGGLASAPFDGEGVPCRRNVLIEGGVLKGFLHNSYTAAKAGISSTGNAARGSFRSTPGVGRTNLYIAPGQTEPSQLIGRVASGLYLTEVLGMHTANPITGDFSVGAAGRLIENGKLTAPVRGITVAGNMLEVLEAVEECGSDLTFMGGSGAPTVVVGRMAVSG